MPVSRRFPIRRVSGVDIIGLPLTPLEAFVLSQLDAAADLAELALLTSRSEAELELALDRLSELGAIENETAKREIRASPSTRPRGRDPRRDDDDDAPPREEQFRPKPPPSPKKENAAPISPIIRTKSEPPPTPTSPPSEDDYVEIDQDRRRRIDDVFSKIESLSHYELLEVSPKATKKEIKAAYYPVIAIFHPDRYFGKRIGGYKKKLERIFEKLTHAYNVLTRDKTRAEYDSYLRVRQRTRSYDAVLSSIPPPPPPSEPAVAAVAQPAPAMTLPAPTVTVPTSPEAITRVASTPAQSPHAAKRLARQFAPPSPTKAPEPAARGATVSPRVEEDLKRMLSLRTAKRDAAVEKFVKAGSEALESKQHVSAVNALRIALSLAPDDEQIRTLYENAERQAAVELAQSYESRAQYEERNHQFAEAARSYQQLARGRPNQPAPLDKAAECLLLAGAEPRRAVELARQAVMLAPTVVGYRKTLAKAYEAAGFTNSAHGEVKRALELRAGDPELTEWAARLTRADR